jgi:hypothetical protein
MRETVSQLLMQIDEAWIDHMERMKDRSCVSAAELQLEELLFSAEAWLEQVQHDLRRSPSPTNPPPVPWPTNTLRPRTLLPQVEQPANRRADL